MANFDTSPTPPPLSQQVEQLSQLSLNLMMANGEDYDYGTQGNLYTRYAAALAVKLGGFTVPATIVGDFDEALAKVRSMQSGLAGAQVALQLLVWGMHTKQFTNDDPLYIELHEIVDRCLDAPQPFDDNYDDRDWDYDDRDYDDRDVFYDRFEYYD